MTTDQQLELAIRHQVMLERLKSNGARNIRRSIQELEDAIEDILTTLKVPDLSDISRTKLRQTLSQVRMAQVEVMGESLRRTTKDLDELAKQESKAELDVLNSQVKGKPFKRVKFERVTKAWRENVMSTNGRLFEEFFNDYTTSQLKQATGLIRRAHSEGWTLQQAVRGYRGTRANGYRDGLAEVSKRHAEAVVRTGYQHISQQARNEVWVRNDDIVEGYKWVSTLDGRTTQQCRSLDGRVFKLGKGPQPPIHIACRSTTIAEMGDFLDFLDKDGTRSALDGPVDADMSYYEWLKTQPMSFQQEAIGKTRAALLNSGKLDADEFARLNLNRNFEPLTLEEMRKKRPKLFEDLTIPTSRD